MVGLDRYTKSLLHFKESNGSVIFHDECGKIWTPGFTAQISTASGVFWNSSGLFDGNSDWIDTPYHDDFNLGSGDFTIDFWMKTTQTTAYATIVSKATTPWTTGDWTILTSSTSSGDLAFWVYDYNSATPILITTGSQGNSGAWTHIAVVRNGTDWNLYVNGVSDANASSAATILDRSDGIFIGADDTYDRFYNGNLAEFRFSKGIARWTTDFTPPATPYRRANNVKLFAVD